MARILTVCPFTGKVLTITSVVQNQLLTFLTEVVAVHMDIFGNIHIHTFVEFRIIEVEIHKDIIQVMQLFPIEHAFLLG